MLTTVDENDVLEVYINVPVQQAPQLKLGLPVRLVDDRGKVLATNKITFVSPNVDTATQSVLAKAQLVDGRGQFRSDQFVRARIVWTTAPGLTVPVTAVARINAQFFAFVAEKSDEGMVGEAEARAARRDRRQRLRRAERPDGRRAADRVGPAEDSRRRAGDAGAASRRRTAGTQGTLGTRRHRHDC